MQTLRRIACFFLLACLQLPAQPARSSRVWYLQDGSKVEGAYVRLLADKLVLKQKGKETMIPRAWLSPVSEELAIAIEKGMNDKTIDAVLLMEFAPVTADGLPNNTFEMGADKKVVSHQEFEPNHRVQITRPFLLKTTEVTWSEWNAVRELRMGYGERGYNDLAEGRNGYHGDESGSHPVTDISWLDAVKWCNLKSQIENRKAYYRVLDKDGKAEILRIGQLAIYKPASGEDPVRNAEIEKIRWLEKILIDPDSDGYRLPTEAEWELAWRRGGWARGFAVNDSWNFFNSERNTRPVRTRPTAAAYRFHDMLGNVAEWCWDWKAPIEASFESDPLGPPTGTHHVFRGGSWADDPMCCTPTYRGDYSPSARSSCFIGFRPARNIPKNLTPKKR